MAIIPSGVWPIDPTITSGSELAAYLNDWVKAFNSQSSSSSRPPTIDRGGVWAKTLGASDIALMLFDGTSDYEIGKVVGGTPMFGGGTNAGTVAPSGAAVGDVWFDTGAGLLKVYDGANWNAVGNKPNAGTTAPSGPLLGTTWFDTGAGKLKVYNGSSWDLVASSTTTPAFDPLPLTLDKGNQRVGIAATSPTNTLTVNGTIGGSIIATSAEAVDATNNTKLLTPKNVDPLLPFKIARADAASPGTVVQNGRLKPILISAEVGPNNDVATSQFTCEVSFNQATWYPGMSCTTKDGVNMTGVCFVVPAGWYWRVARKAGNNTAAIITFVEYH